MVNGVLELGSGWAAQIQRGNGGCGLPPVRLLGLAFIGNLSLQHELLCPFAPQQKLPLWQLDAWSCDT